ncbi:K(+)-transporting ATPase subunit F [Acidovorax sp. 106]|uniref:K(+)-transporting ATPase subunit F n=1 Tax=Acidovorax sp. 106 TaxID=2135637 RepID=UPI001F19FDD9|nr:K(+)-transporting ATPase subunit F [Acidovorax sp. 106]
MSQGGRYGLDIFSDGRPALAGRLWLGQGLRTAATAGARGAVMTSGWMILAAMLAAGLLVYLIAVLLRPEDFS